MVRGNSLLLVNSHLIYACMYLQISKEVPQVTVKTYIAPGRAIGKDPLPVGILSECFYGAPVSGEEGWMGILF